MNFSKIICRTLLLFLSGIVLFGACTREAEPTPSTDEIRFSGKKVQYTVLVVLGGNTSFKSTNIVDSAVVSLVMNDSIYNTPTDSNGLATFNNLPAGVAAVTVQYPEYTTAKLIVDISAKKDTSYGKNNLFNASTMVALFPLTGSGTATISGKALADLDAVTPGLENVPEGLQINTYIEPDQLVNYINHTGDGEILSIAYENATNNTSIDADSDFEIIVPATGSGIDIILRADDFEYDQIVTGGTQRKIFKAIPDTIKAISGVHYYIDPQFE